MVIYLKNIFAEVRNDLGRFSNWSPLRIGYIGGWSKSLEWRTSFSEPGIAPQPAGTQREGDEMYAVEAAVSAKLEIDRSTDKLVAGFAFPKRHSPVAQCRNSGPTRLPAHNPLKLLLEQVISGKIRRHKVWAIFFQLFFANWFAKLISNSNQSGSSLCLDALPTAPHCELVKPSNLHGLPISEAQGCECRLPSIASRLRHFLYTPEDISGRRRFIHLMAVQTDATFIMAEPTPNKSIRSTGFLVSRFMVAASLVLALSGLFPYSSISEAYAAGKVLSYGFNEGSGAVATNDGSAGIAFNGTINGPSYFPDVRPGSSGQVLSFDGANDYVSIPDGLDSTVLGFNTSLVTVEAWIKPDAVDGARTIWSDYGYGGHQAVGLAIKDGKAQFIVSTFAGGVISEASAAGGTLCTEKWQHIAGVYDGSTAKVFVNGVEKASAPASGVIYYGYAGISTIGSDAQATTTLNFKGVIDDFRMWDEARTAGQLGDGQANTGNCANVRPVAVAGENLIKNINSPPFGTIVYLDGTHSFDHDEGPHALTYQWTQTAGPTVTLVGNTSATPNFKYQMYSPAVFTFSLVVNDGADDSLPDFVTVKILDTSKLYICQQGCIIQDENTCSFNLAACNHDCEEQQIGVSSLRTAKQSAFDLPAFLQTYRDVRDRLLALTPEGQRFIQLYNTHNAEILELLPAHPDLVDKSMDALLAVKPLFDALLAGKGANVVITAGQMQAVNAYLNALTATGSPALQQDIADLRTGWGSLDNYVGKTMSQAQTTVLGHGVFLPRLSNP